MISAGRNTSAGISCSRSISRARSSDASRERESCFVSVDGVGGFFCASITASTSFAGCRQHSTSIRPVWPSVGETFSRPFPPIFWRSCNLSFLAPKSQKGECILGSKMAALSNEQQVIKNWWVGEQTAAGHQPSIFAVRASLCMPRTKKYTRASIGLQMLTGRPTCTCMCDCV